MRVVLLVFYILIGIPQVLAISSGLKAGLSLSWAEAGMIGLLIGYLPLVGPVAAIEAARIAWGWPWPLGILIFIWTIPLSLALWIPNFERNLPHRRLRVSSGHSRATRSSSPLQGALPEPEDEQLGPNGQCATASGSSLGGTTYDWLHALARDIVARPEQFGENPVADPGQDVDRAGIKELVVAAKDHPSEAFDLAVRYLLDGSKGRDLRVAFHLFQGAAQTGVRSAQFNLAVMYEHGDAVGRNPDAALEWYRQAAGRAHVRAMFRLADAHKQGELGVPIDPQKEAEWLAKVVRATLEAAQARRA